MIALVMGISLMSCQGNATADATKTGDSTAAEEQVVEKKVDINELLAKAKAEGANWSVGSCISLARHQADAHHQRNHQK